MTDNLTIWNTLGKTDPHHTKGFTRGGGFKGTAIKPIYTEQKMTEVFGPVGIGWGFSEPQFQIINGSDGQVAVYCWLSLWYVQDGVKSDPIPGVGGDFVVVKQSSGLRTDDEAFKKAFTDALGNAMKHLGMSADVHMGLFDDSKYMRDLKEEFAADPAPPKVPDTAATAGPSQYLATAYETIDRAASAVQLRAWWESEAPVRKRLGIVKGTPDYEGLFATFADRGKHLSAQSAIAAE